MLLQDATHYGEAKAGALFPRGEIGLEQAVAVLLGQPGAVVDHVDHDVGAFTPDRHLDAPAPERGRGYRGNRLGGVLDDVGHRLGNQPAVELGRHRAIGGRELDVDLGMADAHQEHHLAHRIDDILRGDHRLRHAGKPREFVDHALDVLDLAHDRIGALLEHRAVLGDHAAVFAPQPLGGELDRGQRILDLVGDAAGNVGPRGGALRHDEIRDVVERHHVAVLDLGRLLGRHPDREVALAAVMADRDLALALHAALGLVKQRRQLRHDRRERPAEHVRLGSPDELFRRTIEDADTTFGVDADDAGTGAGQDGFGEAAAAVDDVMGAHQIVALGSQLLRHLVERLAEMPEIALAVANRHTDVEVPGRDQAGGADQATDRRDQAVGEIQPDPDRRKQHDQRDHRVHRGKRHLDARAARLQALIFEDDLSGIAQQRDDAGVDGPCDVEINVVVTAQLDHRGHGAGFFEQPDRRFGVADVVEHTARRDDEIATDLEIDLLDHRPIVVDEKRIRQAADGGLPGQKLAEPLAILIVPGFGAGDIERHRLDVASDQRLVLADIGPGDPGGVLDDVFGTLGEPAVETAVERDRGRDRDEDRRHRGDHREQPDDLHVQPGAGAPPAPRLEDRPKLQGDHREQDEHRHRVGHEQGEDDHVGGADRRQVV